MNNVNLIGRLTAVPELRYTSQGTAVTNVTLACDDRFKKDVSYFFGCTIWGKSAEILQQYAVKGQKIGVTGRLSQDVYTPPGSDKEVRKTHITVDTFDFLEKPQGQGGKQSPAPSPAPHAAEPAGAAASAPGGDDIPF